MWERGKEVTDGETPFGFDDSDSFSHEDERILKINENSITELVRLPTERVISKKDQEVNFSKIMPHVKENSSSEKSCQ